MRSLAISFTNFGPYHLARLRALAETLEEQGTRLIAYETAGTEARYPWMTERKDEPFDWVTLFPNTPLETLSSRDCAQAITSALSADPPDAVAIVGYARPESHAALKWAERRDRPRILLSESQEIDHPRVWWKEAIKRQRVMRYSAGLVGGPRHRDYLVKLGMPASRIVLGYNAVDNERFTALADQARELGRQSFAIPSRPFFLAVSRFVTEKNLHSLIEAYSQYRDRSGDSSTWDLVICGGGPCQADLEQSINATPYASSIHLPGFLQDHALAPFYAFASAFVHPSVMEPWGLVANEAATCGVPLLISDRAGCVETLVPEPFGTTGFRFDPHNLDQLTDCLIRVTALDESERAAMGERAAQVVSYWGPDRFARGLIDAWELAESIKKPNRSASGVHQ